MIGWVLFYNPMTLPHDSLIWLMLPLCLGVAVVYKTIRTEDLRRLIWQIAGLMCLIVGGLTALGTVLWLIQKYWP